MRFGEVLRRHRLSAGLTQETLAELSGLSVRGISDLERGERARPHRQTVRLLADALNLDSDARRSLEDATRFPAVRMAQAEPPATFTPLLGREHDLKAATAMLDRDEVRLLTLSGPGGVGKTRLALELTEQAQTRFEGGARFVSLAALRDPHLVPATIAHALGVTENSARPLPVRLTSYLKSHRLLLVLDSCEHLASMPKVVAELLASCRQLKVLATSRSPLRITSEHEYVVPPLDDQAAVDLFVRRAAAACSDFDIDRADRRLIGRICARLDRLPLAIELAAARVRLLPPAAMLARLDNSLDLLVGGPLDLPERQRTLRSTIEWSHDLLKPDEQALFRRLAVFRGGWTAESCAALDDGSTPTETLNRLESLLDEHLVRSLRTAHAEPRFTLLDTIGDFANERLVLSGESEAVRRRHAHHYLEFVEAARPRLLAAEQAQWFARVQEEHENLRAALAWSIEHGEPELAAQLAGGLAWFWLIRGRLSEGRGWLERVLQAPDLAQAGRAVAVLGLAMMAWSQADYNSALTAAEEAVGLFRELGDSKGLANALNYVARVVLEQGDNERVRAALAEATDIFERAGDVWGACFSTAMLGRLAWAEGDIPDGIAILEGRLGALAECGDLRGAGFYHAYLSGMALDLGQLAVAQSHAEASLSLFAEIGDLRGTGYALMFLAGVARERGELDEASSHYRACLELLGDFGPQLESAWALEGCLLLHAARGERETALRLWGAATAARAVVGAPLPALWQANIDRRLLPIRQALGHEASWAAFRAGSELQLADAITEAINALRVPAEAAAGRG